MGKKYDSLKGYAKFYAWATWADLEEAVSSKPLRWWKRLARRWLPVPRKVH